MKSNVKKQSNDKIMLSIGMIVKNEEKHLDKCLSALQKLRDNVSNELIIVDTGSTDKTKEIALKYTDKVYDFEWINDFSAARNYGLKKAKGMWFMFLDADEYLDEDCDEMIKFFNMPELYNRYRSASYVIRNYFNSATEDCADFLGSRLVKLEPGVEFNGKIHENLPFLQPHGYFSTVFHHYGYLSNDANHFNKRTNRNLPLLLEKLEKDPEDLNTIGQLIDGATTLKKKLEYVEKGNELVKLERNYYYVNSFYLRAVKCYMNAKRIDDALKVSEDFLNREGNEDSVTSVAIHALRARAYTYYDMYEKAIESYDAYFKAYDKYKAGKLNILDLRIVVVEGCSEYEHRSNLFNYIGCLWKTERYKEAYEYMNKFSIDKMKIPELKKYLNSFREMLKKEKNYKQTAELYSKILALNDPDKTGLMLFLLEEYYKENEYIRDEFVSDMIAYGGDGPYIELMRIVNDSNNGVDVADRVKDFIDSVDSWEDGYSEAIFLAMKHNVDLSELILKLNHNLMRTHFQILSQGHSDFSEIIMEYCENMDFSSNIKLMLWTVSALEVAVLTLNKLLYNQKKFLYDFFICTLSDYIYNIYNPELLNPQDIDVLPELHRFGYYMTLAFSAKNDGDDIGYIRALKEALRLCEPMKDLVAFYLAEFEEELRTR